MTAAFITVCIGNVKITETRGYKKIGYTGFHTRNRLGVKWHSLMPQVCLAREVMERKCDESKIYIRPETSYYAIASFVSLPR